MLGKDSHQEIDPERLPGNEVQCLTIQKRKAKENERNKGKEKSCYREKASVFFFFLRLSERVAML